MRAAICLVMLMLVPLASGWIPDEGAVPTQADSGAEFLLVLDEGVWTSNAWSLLVEQGIQPLRSVQPNVLLVWMDGRSGWPDNARVEVAPDAMLRSAPLIDEGITDYRVLLEPRLPHDAIRLVGNTMKGLGFDVLSASLDVKGNIPASMTVTAPHLDAVSALLLVDGVLWVEPVLETKARNAQASSLIEHGSTVEHPFWTLGLNGSGVVLGVADSGLDADHACFRNATSQTSEHAELNATYPAVGEFGPEHRKIVQLNSSIDGNDTPGHSDYRHGTHVIGSLACRDVYSFREGGVPVNGSTLAHGAKLVVQDIVSSAGWSPPDVDQLLWETSLHGGMIHSNSWGDDTTAYTERTGQFDAYARAMPWSLAFVAPGNTGEGVLEPANGRNVIAVSASTKSVETERWGSTSYGPTEAETNGIFLLAPGADVQSAGADGFWDTNNANLRPSSGTSMATPHASGAAAVLQQLYEDGWIVPSYASLEPTNLSELQPAWAEQHVVDSILLGDGFTPSSSLMRASLAMATSPLSNETRNGGEGGLALNNPYDGWGVLNLSRLFDPGLLSEGDSPSRDTWIHDSYRLTDGSVAQWFETNGGTTANLSGMLDNDWNGEGSIGPYLQTGDVFTQRLTPLAGHDVRIRMSFPAQPEPAVVDDLQLRVRLEDGTVLLSNELQGDGSPTLFFGDVVDTNNTTMFFPSNETTFGIDIPSTLLNNSSYIDVDVVARFVQPGGSPGQIGLDGDAVGFALIVKGVDRDSADYLDDDGDGVVNVDDACPLEDARADDEDLDGCLDDDDGDGVVNIEDACPTTSSEGFDSDDDGCLDDSDGDGITDDVDECLTPDLDWPVMENGCYPNDHPLVLDSVHAPMSGAPLDGEFTVRWNVSDVDGDGYVMEVALRSQSAPNITLLNCTHHADRPGEGACTWSLPDDFPPYYQTGERYSLHLRLSSSNMSPAAHFNPMTMTVAEDLWIEEPKDGAFEPAGERRSTVMIWLGLLSLIVGMLVARRSASTKQTVYLDKHPPPFQTSTLEEE
ncbi:MAG: S8 family serine peptidase [Poseidonia sp.]